MNDWLQGPGRACLGHCNREVAVKWWLSAPATAPADRFRLIARVAWCTPGPRANLNCQLQPRLRLQPLSESETPTPCRRGCGG